MDQALVALLLPFIGLVIVLLWLYFIVCNKESLKININAFGVKLNLSANKGESNEQDKTT
jgi:hypothetical protein